MAEQAAPSYGYGIPAVGDVLANKYRVEGLVGRGGMGVVLAARHLQLGQSVAIKLLTLPPDEDHRDEAISRFLHEAQAAARLQTEHVVRIYDVGQLEGGLPFMVMELLHGSDLGSLLDQRGPLPEAEAVDYVLQACAGIAEAHQMGIVHRDLKPANLFVTRRSDGLPLLKVLDFGISKQLTDPSSGAAVPTFTNARTLMGSPNYMSPEQIRDARRVDARADVWAMGIILQELVTHAPVFQAESFPGVCAAIIADPPAPVRSLRPDVSDKLERIISRCLQKDAAARYQTIDELAAELSPLGARASRGDGTSQPLIYSPPPRVSPGSAPTHPPTERADAQPAAALGFAPPGPRSGTLESARLAPADGTHSPLSSPDSRIELIRTPSATTLAPRRSLARWLLPLGAGAALVGSTLWWQLRAGAPPSAEGESSAQVTPPAPDTRFTLRVDSEPPGATVSEGSARLGSTPFSLSIDLPEGATPRVFVIEKEGFQPYVLRQGPAQGAVQVLAALSKTPAPPAASVAAPASASPPLAAPAAKAPPAAKHPSPPPVAKPPSDLRLER